jgi:hypothetical protein
VQTSESVVVDGYGFIGDNDGLIDTSEDIREIRLGKRYHSVTGLTRETLENYDSPGSYDDTIVITSVWVMDWTHVEWFGFGVYCDFHTSYLIVTG